MSQLTALIGVLVVLCSCGKPDRREIKRSPSIAGPRASADTVLDATVPVRRSTWMLPRREFDATLIPLWERVSSDTDSTLLAPAGLFFSQFGLLVFDAGDRSIQRFDTRNGQFLARAGREGGGPGELSARMWLQGSYAAPTLYDATRRRFATLVAPGPSIETRALGLERSVSSSCALSIGALVSAPANVGAEFLILGDSGIIDSLSAPWPDLALMHRLARQAILAQLNDTSCVALTLYGSDFAVVSSQGAVRTATYVEALGPPQVVRRAHPDGRGATVEFAPDTVSGPWGAAGWREFVVVLFGGRGDARRRTLDFYRLSDLGYAGSLKLPFVARGLAIRADTVAIYGERDDYPAVAAFRLTSR